MKARAVQRERATEASRRVRVCLDCHYTEEVPRSIFSGMSSLLKLEATERSCVRLARGDREFPVLPDAMKVGIVRGGFREATE